MERRRLTFQTIKEIDDSFPLFARRKETVNGLLDPLVKSDTMSVSVLLRGRHECAKKSVSIHLILFWLESRVKFLKAASFTVKFSLIVQALGHV